MNQYTLVNLVKQGNEDAYKMLIQEFTPMIYSLIYTHELDKGDYSVSIDDLFQEGCIALYESCLTYKDIDIAKFSTYAYVIIKRRLNRVYYQMLKPYNIERYSIDNNEHPEFNSILAYTCVSDNDILYLTNEATDLNKLSIPVSLTNIEQAIVKLRMNNYSYKEIANKLKISEKKVDNILTRIRKRIKRK